MTNLYLFDIDGTLLDVVSLHLKAWKAAYKELYNIDTLDKTYTSKFGEPEPQMHKDLCIKFGIEPTKDTIKKLREYRYKTIIKGIEEGVKPFPGVKSFLDELVNRKEILGVITGNPISTGRKLLESSNLLGYFSIQSYSDNISNRVELIYNAIVQAKKVGRIYNKIIVIGDTKSDIEAGKAVDAFTVGVTSTYTTEQQFNEAGADLVISSFLEYKKILDEV